MYRARPADPAYTRPPSGSTRLASIHSVGVLIARLGGHLDLRAFGIVFRRADRSRHRRSAHTLIPLVAGRTARATTGKPQRLQRVRYGAACSSRRVGLCGGLCVRVSGMPHGTHSGTRTNRECAWPASDAARPWPVRGERAVSVACAGVAVRRSLGPALGAYLGCISGVPPWPVLGSPYGPSLC